MLLKKRKLKKSNIKSKGNQKKFTEINQKKARRKEKFRCRNPAFQKNLKSEVKKVKKSKAEKKSESVSIVKAKSAAAKSDQK